MNRRFIARGLLLAVVAMIISSVLGFNWIIARTQIGQPPDPTPPSPSILEIRGEMPSGPGGLQEWVRYRDREYALAGSGFLLVLENDMVIALTTAHSLTIGDPNRPLERIALAVAGQIGFEAELDTLWGPPGVASTGDLSVDYVLLMVEEPVDPQLILVPDPRGNPQPGERVALFSGLGDGEGGRRVLEGTVQSVGETDAWVLMDEETFNPALMSGSPFVSLHTGKVVGMVISSTPRDYRVLPLRYRLLLGMHPIGSLVHLAKSAVDFPELRDYQR